MANVLIFGGGLQALSAAHSLRLSGCRVVMATKGDRVASRSRFIDKHIELEDDSDSEQLLPQLSHIVEEESIDVIIPMEDEQAACLSRCKARLENGSGVKCAVAEDSLFSMVSDKSSFISFCEKNALPHPKTIALKGEGNEHEHDGLAFPLLIKPNHAAGARGLTLVRNVEELDAMLPRVVSSYGACTLQEYISVKDYYYNVMLYRDANGRFVNHCILKILRYYPINGGSSCCGITVEQDDLLRICEETLDKLDWVGFADFDVLEGDDGDFRLVELNPRLPACLRAAEVSGVNFPMLIVSDALGGGATPYVYSPGKVLRFLGLDLAWFLCSSNRFKATPSWFRFFGKNLFYQEGGRYDAKAFACSMLEGARKFFSKSFRAQKSGMN
jgi:Predicted ATP-grasp enzyme